MNKKDLFNNSLIQSEFAEVAQLIERQPSKLRVAGLSPVFRSKKALTICKCFLFHSQLHLILCVASKKTSYNENYISNDQR